MNGNIIDIRRHQKVIDAVRASSRQGTTLRYQPRQGVRELKCDTCHAFIRFGRCGCPPVSA